MTKLEFAAGQGTLWRQVARELRNRITTGQYPVGTYLPREVDLAAEMDVSRNTIREAFRLLAEIGLVDRRKRLGTIVLDVEPRPTMRLTVDPFIALERLRHSTYLQPEKRITAPLPPEILSRWSGDPIPPERWRHVHCTRTTIFDDAPWSLTSLYFAPGFEKAAKAVGSSHHSIQLVREKCGVTISEARSVLTPAILSDEVRATLGLTSSNLAIVVTNFYTDSSGTVTHVSEGTTPEERLKFELSFSVSPDYGSTDPN